MSPRAPPAGDESRDCACRAFKCAPSILSLSVSLSLCPSQPPPLTSTTHANVHIATALPQASPSPTTVSHTLAHRRIRHAVKEYVLKLYHKDHLTTPEAVARVRNEATVLGSAAAQSCRFVVRYHGRFQTPQALVLVTEKVQRRDLWSLMYDTAGRSYLHRI